MNRTWLLAASIGCLALSGTSSRLLGQTPFAGIGQQLRSQYRIAMVGSDRVSVIAAGSVLIVAQNGIKASPPSAFGCWYNSHKPGNGVKYSTVSEALTPVDMKTQMRFLQVGEKVVIVRLDVKPSAVDFCVQTYSDNPNDAPYRAEVLFQFQQKNYVQDANLKAIQDSIAEVFTLDTTTPTEGSGSALGETTRSEPQAATTRLGQVAGLYVLREAPDNRLQLNADGTFLLVQLGKNYSGTFTIYANKLTIHQTGVRTPQQAGTIQGDTLIDPKNSVWVKQTPATTVAVPTVAPLHLPSTYVNVQTPTDQIQLNADNSFTLQEAGQSFQGTFVASGNAVELNISGGTKTTATIQGDDLTDSGGQKWVRREQPAGTASAGPMLKNEDIVKMVKAGLDDALIIAKIDGSKCQFDTSPDALIQLKQSGVSAAVLKAVVAAGK